MHHRGRARRFARLRQHWLSQSCALAFIVLILLPFTAPFPTCQLNDSSTGRPFDAPKDVKDKLGADQALTLPQPPWHLAPPALSVHGNGAPACADQLNARSPQHTVLRL